MRVRPRSSLKKAWLLSAPSTVLLLSRPEMPRKLTRPKPPSGNGAGSGEREGGPAAAVDGQIVDGRVVDIGGEIRAIGGDHRELGGGHYRFGHGLDAQAGVDG